MDKIKTNPATVPDSNVWGRVRYIHTLALMGVTLLGIYLCYCLTLPFLSSMAWALALAIMFAPIHLWLESKVKHPSLAAMISVLMVSLIVVVPATFVGQRLVHEAVKGAELIKTKVDSGEWRHALETHPRLAPLADWMERENLPATVKTVANWLTSTGAPFIKGSMVELIGLLLTFYLLFFFLRDRRVALQMLRSLSPLSAKEMDQLLIRVGDTIYATIYGTLAVSVVQGFLGGLMFWWLGLPAPLLWGVVMALLAIVPVLGAFIIWVPAAIYLAIIGSYGSALILSIWGIFVVGTIDNLLQPMLMGNRLQLHTILAFISVVGGLIVFGPAGLILGPVTLTVTMVLLEIWHAKYI